MAYGSHWEWRGFGGVSGRFAACYHNLETYYELHSIYDRYIRIPGLNVNTKFRKGAENGLKFKRPEKKNGDFEIWIEDENEMYDFPLSDEGWNRLLKLLESTPLALRASPPSSFTQNYVEQWLKQAGCKIVEVYKERESKIWRGENGSVLVEWTCISEPQSIVSIGLENYSESDTDDLMTEEDKKILKSAVQLLGLSNEPLHPMNYMDAVKLWAKGNKI